MKTFRFFDAAATTRCLPRAAQAVEDFATAQYGNPSSAHALGRTAAEAIEKSRAILADAFNTLPGQIVFTGSGTEADNLAISGVALARLFTPTRILCSATEHAAVKKPVEGLSDFRMEGLFIPVDSNGQVQATEMEKLLTPDTALVSIHQVNNISGAILPVEELAKRAKAKFPNLYFHSDCVQSFGKIPHPKNPSAIDLVSISAHKVGGPKGVGALVFLNPSLMENHRLHPLLNGGGQEGGWRAGTQNAGLIAGFGIAAQETLSKQPETFRRIAGLRSLFLRELQSHGLMPFLSLNSPSFDSGLSLPHVLSISFPGFPGPLLAEKLEDRGFLVSTGSACSSKKAEPDSTLMAMGRSCSVASCAIRITFGTEISEEDTRALASALKDSLNEISALFCGKALLSA